MGPPDTVRPWKKSGVSFPLSAALALGERTACFLGRGVNFFSFKICFFSSKNLVQKNVVLKALRIGKLKKDMLKMMI